MGEKPANSKIEIRELQSYDDLAAAVALEREVWRLDDADALPMTLAVALQASGSLFLGAFCGPSLVGLAFSFPARERDRWAMHSHLLAVKPEFRDFNVGNKLKLAQRAYALDLKLQEITWTFDPLQSKNAHLNFAKLGAVSEKYKVDFYGASTSSVLHQNRTDRLWVTWPVASRRVQRRLAGEDPRPEMIELLNRVEPLVRFGADGIPARGILESALGRQRIVIEIPSEIDSIEKQAPQLASEWRDATRWAFTEALGAGFFVKEFCSTVRGRQGPGAYLLERGPVSEQIPELA
jgi:predicted GNAT superfamily acetyltransferase